MLAKSNITQQGVIFPISASILDKIDEYRMVLENYSHPLLELYDEFKRFLDDQYEMPDKLVHMLVRFLEQNNEALSNRARKKVFSALNEEEVKEIEKTFPDIFGIE
jgi:hypothetical protein